MAKHEILVVDDEKTILELVEYNLTRHGYKVKCVESGEEALKKAKTDLPDLIILDLMLPGLDGLEVCKQIRSNATTGHIPIIMLTARGEEADIVTGLELGADDYITKPFSPRVLLARVKAALRRKTLPTPDRQSTLKIRDLVIQPGRREVLLKGRSVDLTNSEFRLLHFLALRPGWVFTRNQIIAAVRGEGYPVTDRSVDVQVVGLRKKLGEFGECIETVRGVGYRFKE